MASNMRAIRLRIKSVEGTRKITKSMKVVSASKMRRVQKMRGTLSAFSDKSEKMLAHVLASVGETDDPYLRAVDSDKMGAKCLYVVFVGNRGLCGSFNQDLVDYIKEKAAGIDDVVVCGAWGSDVFKADGISVIRQFDTLSDAPTAEEAAEVAAYLKALFRKGEADRIVLVYQAYVSALTQTVTERCYLPIDRVGAQAVECGKSADRSARSDDAAQWQGGAQSQDSGVLQEAGQFESDYIFEPDKASILDALTELYTESLIHAVMLESRLSEHTARMRTMTAATDNTEELIQSLTLELNHARQAAITTEISEIVGGASALHTDR